MRFISQKTTYGLPVMVRIILAPIAQLEMFQTFLKVTLLTIVDHITASLWVVELSMSPIFCIL